MPRWTRKNLPPTQKSVAKKFVLGAVSLVEIKEIVDLNMNMDTFKI